LQRTKIRVVLVLRFAAIWPNFGKIEGGRLPHYLRYIERGFDRPDGTRQTPPQGLQVNAIKRGNRKKTGGVFVEATAKSSRFLRSFGNQKKSTISNR
jgi:hypothetical protein